jgi:FKBP-type peptidyl-prolyl cis-trans isomerase FkpA
MKTLTSRAALLLSAVTLLGGCGGDASSAARPFGPGGAPCALPEGRTGAAFAGATSVDPTSVEYASSLNIDFSQMAMFPSGLYCIDRSAGDGEVATTGRSVTVHYTGYFPNGNVFDSSRDRNQPFSIELGANQVIAGWEIGIPGMQVGGRRTIVIPPHLAYGPQGAGGVIPPNAVLVFDIELLGVN